MQQRIHARDKEGRRNLVAIEHVQNARSAALGAEVGGRQRRRRGGAVPQQRRLGVIVETEAYCDPRAAGPRPRRQLAAHADRSYGLAKLLLGPLRAGLAPPLLRHRHPRSDS